MLPAARSLFVKWLPNWAERIYFVTVHNEFLGGNIKIMDMATVDDMARAIARETIGVVEPDLLLVPASGFNGHGRDIAGRHWSELEKFFHCSVSMIQCGQFLF